MADLENPFACMQAEAQRLRAITPCILVDIHAEATSEKIALARMLDGQVSAVVGTHTHVQTADEQIFPGERPSCATPASPGRMRACWAAKSSR